MIKSDFSRWKSHFFTHVADLKGEKPYLIIADAADAKIEQTSDVKIPVTPLRLPQVNAPGYSMLGTLSYIDNEKAAGMKAYVLQPDAQWHSVSNDGKSNIAPYRAFIQVNGTKATRAIQSWFEDVDGSTGETVLKTIDFDGKERYYDLNGRQLNAAPKQGVTIDESKTYTLNEVLTRSFEVHDQNGKIISGNNNELKIKDEIIGEDVETFISGLSFSYEYAVDENGNQSKTTIDWGFNAGNGSSTNPPVSGDSATGDAE